MANTKYKLESTKELTSLFNNVEYYNNMIGELLRKEVDNNLNKFGINDATDRDIDIQLACLAAGVSTKEWVDDCIRNYRILVQKANLGLMPSANNTNNINDTNKAKENNDDNRTTTKTTEQVSTETQESTITESEDISF